MVRKVLVALHLPLLGGGRHRRNEVTYEGGWWLFGGMEVKMYGGKAFFLRPLRE